MSSNALELSPGRALQPVFQPGETGTDDPRREIRTGAIFAVLFFVLFLGWASVARLDAAAQAPGKLVVSGQRQTVQHREGGVVADILVKEGDRVKKGQILIRLAGGEVLAQERALTAQAIGLLAQRARLDAEQAGRSSVTPPIEFASLKPEDRAAAAESLRIQQSQLRTRAAVLNSQEGAFGQRANLAHAVARSFLRLSPSRHNVASVRRRSRLGNRREGGALLAGPHRALEGAHRLRPMMVPRFSGHLC